MKKRKAADGISPVLTPSGLSILAVDDEVIVLRRLARCLTAAGHAVCCAANGREGLQLVHENNPELIITDWLMPEIDGLEFCKAVRRNKNSQDIYIIMLTSQKGQETYLQALEAGADDCTVKPFTSRTLLARIRAAQRIIDRQQRDMRDKEELSRYAADLELANRQLQQSALADPLTGLPNGRYALDRLRQEWALGQRTGRSFACMVVDIDDFKTLCATHGPAAGDLVLRASGAALREVVRTTDVVCRLRNERFLLVCPDTNVTSAQRCAERLRHAIEHNTLEVPGFHPRVTVSICIAANGAPIESADGMLRVAEEALSTAKHAGRNHVCLALPGEA